MKDEPHVLKKITSMEEWQDIRVEAFALGLIRYKELPDADRLRVDTLAKRVLMGSLKDAAAARHGIAVILYGKEDAATQDHTHGIRTE